MRRHPSWRQGNSAGGAIGRVVPALWLLAGVLVALGPIFLLAIFLFWFGLGLALLLPTPKTGPSGLALFATSFGVTACWIGVPAALDGPVIRGLSVWALIGMLALVGVAVAWRKRSREEHSERAR